MSGAVEIEDTLLSELASSGRGDEPQQLPERIGRYTVTARLGGGAMGVVYAAFDAELQRDVAIKLVAGSHGPDADELSERLLREARALARLEHPNVVRVYEVGSFRGQIYIVMERVHGHTLGAWLSLGTRSWRAVLAVLVSAGRGLQAAHEAGLVHRDFKPDNVLIDGADVAHVADFGLVKYSASADPDADPSAPERSADAAAVALTQVGNMIGTPAYMSPEQHFGRSTGPQSDQFSFCIAAYEALYGRRPFAGESWAAIRAQVQAGIVPPPPSDSRVPKRLFRVLARGLAKAPEERWPSMDALLTALAHDPWKVRVRAAAIAGGIVAASAGSYAIAVSQSPGERCQGGSQLAGTWDAEREEAVSRAFAATQLPFAADTWRRVDARIDAYAQAWAEAWTASCEAHASGTATSRMTDLRVACLSRRRTHLRALVEVLTAADAAVVENAIQAVSALPSVAECGDEEALVIRTPIPEDAVAAARVEGLREQLAHASALSETGQFQRGLRVAEQVRAAAEETEYPPLLAEVALAEGRMLMNLGRAVEAEVALARAVKLGIASDLHAVAAEAAATRVYVLGEMLSRRDQGLVVVSFAEPLVSRARDDGRLAALLLNNLGVLHSYGDIERATDYYERSIEALRRRPGSTHPLVPITYHNLGNMFLQHERFDAARVRFEQSIEQFTSLLGENHPLISHPLAGLGDVSLSKGQPREAIDLYKRSLAIMESSYGADHPYLLALLSGLGRAQVLTGHAVEGRRYLARAVEIGDKHAMRSPEAAAALESLGDLAAADGDSVQARGLYEQAAAVFDDALGADSPKGARAALRAGELAAELGDPAGAIAWFKRVMSKKTGAKGQVSVRADAALRLAATLAEDGADARACALVGEAREGLQAGDRRRAAVDALAKKACPKG